MPQSTLSVHPFHMPNAIIFDFNRTLFDPDKDTLMPGALALLASLKKKGIPLFLICKGDTERRKKIEELGLVPFFQKVIVTEQKGAQDFMACKNTLPDHSFIAIGDRLDAELRHAQECNMVTVWFRKGKFANEMPQDIVPQYTIASLHEFDDILSVL
jgi:FMN phosphatase YigB (HAD superfamily)